MDASAPTRRTHGLSQRVRDATRDLHAAVEGTAGVAGILASRDAYAGFLARLWPFHDRMERAFASRDWAGTGIDPAARRKAPLLAADLADLGVAPATAPPGVAWPALPDAAAALGALYVVEGSTLGGRSLLAEAAVRLGVTPARGARFLAGYGPWTGSMWREVVAAVDAIPPDAAGAAALIAAARATFAAAGACLAAPR